MAVYPRGIHTQRLVHRTTHLLLYYSITPKWQMLDNRTHKKVMDGRLGSVGAPQRYSTRPGQSGSSGRGQNPGPSNRTNLSRIPDGPAPYG